MTESDARYARQMRLPGFGPEGQLRLARARVLVAGCGALGTVVSESLVRAGVGTVTIVDRDCVEWSNLQRQTLFTEQDARRGVPKAEAAKARLAQVNASAVVRAFVDDLRPSNALSYARDADLIVDCLDNFETRALLNDCAVLRRIPLIYGGAVGFDGMVAAILPHGADPTVGFGGLVSWSDERSTPCLRCLMPELPAPAEIPTCDTAGVLGPVAGLVGSVEAALAIRLVAEGPTAVPAVISRFDLRGLRFSSASLDGVRDPSCACCARRSFEELSRGDDPRGCRTLCGRNAVEVRLVMPRATDDLDRLAKSLEERFDALASNGTLGDVEHSEHGATRAIRARVTDRAAGAGPTGIHVLIGPSGAFAILEGTADPEQARAAVARWIGV